MRNLGMCWVQIHINFNLLGKQNNGGDVIEERKKCKTQYCQKFLNQNILGEKYD